MKYKHCLEMILSNLNLRYAMTLEANPEPLDEILSVKDRMEDWWEDEINEQEMMPMYHIQLQDYPIQMECREDVDMFDKYEEGEEIDENDEDKECPYYFQNIYTISIYDLKGNFIDGGASFSVDELEDLIKKAIEKV
jgi:hypothetical protein